jgi:hypothetical protein
MGKLTKLAAVVALAGVLAFGLAARADVLITNSGATFEGVVTEDGANYVLVTPAGGKMTFLKSMVKQVLKVPVDPSKAPPAPASAPAKAPPAASAPTSRAAVAATSQPASRPAAVAASTVAVEKALQQTTITKLDCDNLALTGTLDILRNIGKISIFVNWVALKAAGVEQTTPVTVHLANVPLAKALDMVLSEVGGEKLGFEVQEGVVTISTLEQLDATTVTRTHDVRAVPAKGAQLIAVITKSIAPQLWQSAGGRYAISEMNGQLVVTASNRVHIQIATLVKQLAAQK